MLKKTALLLLFRSFQISLILILVHMALDLHVVSAPPSPVQPQQLANSHRGCALCLRLNTLCAWGLSLLVNVMVLSELQTSEMCWERNVCAFLGK